MKMTPKLKQEITEFKNDIEEEKCNIAWSTNDHVSNEFEIIDDILPTLLARKWVLVMAPENSNFITSDNPVILLPTQRSQRLTGLGRTDTLIIFPISKNLAITSDSSFTEITIPINIENVAMLNSKILAYANKQIYTSNTDFPFITTNERLVFFNEKEHWEEVKTLRTWEEKTT